MRLIVATPSVRLLGACCLLRKRAEQDPHASFPMAFRPRRNIERRPSHQTAIVRQMRIVLRDPLRFRQDVQ